MTDVIWIHSQEDMEDVIASGERVVVDFWATWCGPCAKLKPHYAMAAEKSDDVFVTIDIEAADADLVGEYNIQSVPTVLGFKNGALTATIESRTAIPLLREVAAL